MQDRVAKLESRVSAVEKRLSALEGAVSAETAITRGAPEPSLGEDFVANASTHIGRVLLIFGGAYLLRAITDFQFVPTGVGIFMGASYAFFWLAIAFRKASTQSQRASAAFYGGTSVLLALPLLVEAISKFDLLTGQQGTIALTVYCAMALAVAATRNLRTLAWLATGGGLITAFSVMIVSHDAIVVSAFLLMLGLGSLWVVYQRQWLGLQWLGALGANASVVALVVFSSSDQWSLEADVAALLATVLLIAYLLSFVIRSHIRGSDVGIFETVQAVIAAAIAFWAASVASDAGQFDLTLIGLLSAVLGGCAYALALSPLTRSVRGINFFYYSTLGLLFVILGSSLILRPATAAAVWSLMALMMAWFSGRTGWVALSLQCTILLLAAGVSSGILAAGFQALAGDVATAWPAAAPWHLGIAMTTVVCLFLPVAQHSERWGIFAGMPQLIVLALSVWEVGGLMVVYLAPILADTGGAKPSLAVLAALRTAVLSVSSVTLALSSRFKRWPEARWLVYPVLILVAIKLFLEDFPNGQPASLFVALVFVGGALLLVARLLNRDKLTGPFQRI
ncbi:MAG: DUF2339 domain-containing protein [Gammaproteobacteria bacterium]|nr:DUF2339 domain-containing protein [Gammaproteobacteria bacterium]MDH5212804.1 DUF2339 domain-containing protein [Gammaproteobacteria bacterium]